MFYFDSEKGEQGIWRKWISRSHELESKLLFREHLWINHAGRKDSTFLFSTIFSFSWRWFWLWKHFWWKLYFTCRHKMGLKLSPKYFLHLFYCCFNIVCRKPLTVYKRAPFKEIFTVLYGQKRTQTMCKTCFETPKEQTRHGLVPKRDSFLFLAPQVL